jgi:uncharacterized heparinase superfamily protein
VSPVTNSTSILEPLPRPVGAHSERRDRGGLRRIRDLRFAEIAYRGWQEASEWLERTAPAEAIDRPDALLRRQAPDLADESTARFVVATLGPARFFAGLDRAVYASLAARFPEHVGDVLLTAAALVPRQFDTPGYATHQHLVRLAQAYVLSGDERYAATCVHAIETWLDAAPSAGAWTGNVDAAYRIMSWCWVILLLRESPALTGAVLTKLLAALWVHATRVRRSLSYYCSPTPDLTVEALGLLYAALVFPEFKDAPRWRHIATRILLSASDTQISSDGVHVEQSSCYHRYAVDTYLHCLLLATRNGVDIPAGVSERVRRMLDFLLSIRRPDGTIPAIGDDNGGSLLPLVSRDAHDSRGPFAIAGALFRRADYAWAAGEAAPELLWLMGTEGARAFAAVKGVAPLRSSCVFPTGGYAVMRSGWDAEAHQVIVDIGPLGGPVSAGHGHADLLSVQCAIFGEPCLVDAGAHALADEPQWREFFRSTAAHSTVMIDGHSQAEPAGPFGWRRRPRVKLREWHSTPDFDFLDAEHDGYQGLTDPVVHRRRVIFVKPHYWILVDDLAGAARHQIDLMFQFAALDVTLGPHPWARAETASGRVLWVSPFPSGPVQPSLKHGELSPIRGWISPRYGERQPAPLLNYSFAVALPWRIVTVLLPDRQGLMAPPAVRAIYDDVGMPSGVAFERPRRSVRFDDRAVSVERE